MLIPILLPLGRAVEEAQASLSVEGFADPARRNDPNGVAGRLPADLVSRSNPVLVGDFLGDGHLSLARDFGHVLTVARTRSLLQRAAIFLIYRE